MHVVTHVVMIGRTHGNTCIFILVGYRLWFWFSSCLVPFYLVISPYKINMHYFWSFYCNSHQPGRLRLVILLLSLVFTSFNWLKECLTDAVLTGWTSKIFNRLKISENKSAHLSQDSISILISCKVREGGSESCFFSISAFFSLAKALWKTLHSDEISSLSMRGGEVYVVPSSLSFPPIKIN